MPNHLKARLRSYVLLVTAIAWTAVPVYPGASKLAVYRIPNACPGIRTDAEVLPFENIYNLAVTFHGSYPTNDQADLTCRAYLKVAVRKFGSRDIVVSAWFRSKGSTDPNADDQLHPYPGLVRSNSGFAHYRCLVYHAATKVALVE